MTEQEKTAYKVDACLWRIESRQWNAPNSSSSGFFTLVVIGVPRLDKRVVGRASMPRSYSLLGEYVYSGTLLTGTLVQHESS